MRVYTLQAHAAGLERCTLLLSHDAAAPPVNVVTCMSIWAGDCHKYSPACCHELVTSVPPDRQATADSEVERWCRTSGTNIEAFSLHPGSIATGLTRHMGILGTVANYGLSWVSKNLEQVSCVSASIADMLF